jgi:DNA-binding NtrC family response regulator/CRP-like cAMP-binding protein
VIDLARLVEVLDQAGLELSADEIADALWLAIHLGKSADVPSTHAPLVAAEGTSSEDSAQEANPSLEQPRTQGTVDDKRGKGEASHPLLPRTVDAADNSEGERRGIPFRSPAASALPAARQIGQALRPLGRRVPSRRQWVLDERQTAQRIAEDRLMRIAAGKPAEGVVLPVQRPARERHFELALVVDASGSMVIWKQTIAELRRLLATHGAFRDVRIWSLFADDGQARLHPGLGPRALRQQPRKPGELLDPQGRRVILIVSDCVATGWYTGAVARLLAQWATRTPVALVQVLPERLWSGTALAEATHVFVHAPFPGAPNRYLDRQDPWGVALPDAASSGSLAPVPVLTFDPESVASWAQFLAGGRGAWAPGVIFPTAAFAPALPAPATDDALSAAEQVAWFRHVASPQAFRLVQLLAVVPLTLPVMRLVQTMLPRTRQSHLAEVFLGGLLRLDTPADDPDYARYDFQLGVRQELRDSAPLEDAAKVFHHTSAYVAQRLGQPFDFQAIIEELDAVERLSISGELRAFAELAAPLLRQFGGVATQAAERLEQRLNTELAAPLLRRFEDVATQAAERLEQRSNEITSTKQLVIPAASLLVSSAAAAQGQHVLVVDDDPFDNDRYCQTLQSENYQVQRAFDVEEALQMVTSQRVDVVVLDMLLLLRQGDRLDFGGVELLRRIKAHDPTIQVIAVTGYGSRELAAEAMVAGAFDYITKDLDTEGRLSSSVRGASLRARFLRTAQEPHPDHEQAIELTVPGHLIANSAAMRAVLRQAQHLATIDTPLLISGEPGVGKTLLASVIHLNSRYAAGPLVVVPCRGLSASLGELWGDAARPGSGFCAQAEGGTLVLEDIHALPFNQQKVLAEFVRERRYQPLGNTTAINCGARIIATSGVDLERLIRQGRFWRGLYDVLSVATIDVPPLRERRDGDDILAIAGYVLRRYSLAAGISAEAARLLANYEYAQGNIQELEEILRSVATRAAGGEILAEHLPAMLQGAARGNLDPGEAALLPEHSPTLVVRFVPSDPTLVIWQLDVLGSVRSGFTMPFTEGDLPLIVRAMDVARRPASQTGDSPFGPIEQARLARLGLWQDHEVIPAIDRHVGALLYQALVADDTAREMLEYIRNLVVERNAAINVILRFPPEAILLAAVPWELVWEEWQLSLLDRNPLVSCVRCFDLPKTPRAPTARSKPLRLLAVCPAAAIPESVHARERIQRTEAFQHLVDQGLLIVEELQPVQRSTLADRLQGGEPVDILHYYGAGAWREGAGYLRLDDGLLNPNQLAALAGDVPLVVLHTSSFTPINSDDLITGIAPALSEAGIAAIVAMQFSVPLEATLRFSSVLYHNLGLGESLQAAAAKARQALFIEHPQSSYVPVIYIRARDPQPLVLSKKEATTHTLERQSFLSVRGRLAQALIHLASLEPNTGEPVRVAITQQKLADSIGTSREWVNKALRSFTDDGLIRIERGAITLLKPLQLAELVVYSGSQNG